MPRIIFDVFEVDDDDVESFGHEVVDVTSFVEKV
jgi:hypothetical protein